MPAEQKQLSEGRDRRNFWAGGTVWRLEGILGWGYGHEAGGLLGWGADIWLSSQL